jgi:transcriptional regulator with XRE-family HTH domain
MKTSKEIRLTRLEQLISEFGTIEAVAEKSGTAPQYLSQIRNGVKSSTGTARGVGDSLARKLEKGCGKPEGWMDIPFAEPQEEPRESNEVRQEDLLQLISLFWECTPSGREQILVAAQHAEKREALGGLLSGNGVGRAAND